MCGGSIGNASLQRVHLHRHVVLPPALDGGEHDFGIVIYAAGSSIVRGLAVDDQFDL